MTFFDQVYQLVRQIPEGYVTTYGDIARAMGTRDARRVGHALHASAKGRSALGGNPQPICPCHRVVTKEGMLSESYAFGGSLEQYAKLLGEGVIFIDKTHVNLKLCHFTY